MDLEEWRKHAVVPGNIQNLIDELSEEEVAEELTGENQKEAVITEETMGSIETMHEFYQWFDGIEDRVERDADRVYISYIERLKQYQHICQQVMARIDTSLDHVLSLQDHYQQVLLKTNKIRGSCEKLLREKEQLAVFADRVWEKLHSYDNLEVVARRVDELMSKNAMHTELIDLMRQMDPCLMFIRSATGYHKSAAYRTKFWQTHSRALALVKLFVVSNLRSHTSARIREYRAKDGKSPTLRDADVHPSRTAFDSLVPSLRPLFANVEARAGEHESYSQLLTDCQYAYISERQRLLDFVGQLYVRSLRANSEPLDGMAILRKVVQYLVQQCLSECSMVSKFFHPVPSEQMTAFLQEFAEGAHTSVRPIVLRMAAIEDICSLASMVRSEILMDQLQRRKEIAVYVKTAIQRILEDVQERLMFVAQVFIRDEIECFRPKEEDLDYPTQLQKVKEVADSPEERTKRFPSLAAVFSYWYPTLGITLVFLSKLYLALPKRIFEEIASEALSHCTGTLVFASEHIGGRRGLTDGLLFLMMHLAILREQISPFDIEFSTVERRLDFSSSIHGFSNMSSVVGDLFHGKWNDSLRGMWGVIKSSSPQLLANKSSSKRDVEKELIRTTDRVVLHALQLALKPLMDFLSQASNFLNEQVRASAKGAQGGSLSQQNFATPAVLQRTTTAVKSLMDQHLDKFFQQVHLYLHTHCLDTETNLYNTILNVFVQQLSRFYTIVDKYYPPDTWPADLPSLPTQDDMVNLLSSKFPQN